MINGSTIIMNDEYIEELTRHRNICEKNLKEEIVPAKQAKLEEKLNYWNNKINEAMEFQDVIDEVLNLDMPRLMVVKTISGLVLPLKHIQIVE
jgi:hypothetical protein